MGIVILGGDNKMPNRIMQARIDEKLVEGLTVGSWAGTIGANLIIVADDEVAQDELKKKNMQLLISSLGFYSHFYTVEDAKAAAIKAPNRQNILFVCRKIEPVRQLVEEGVRIQKVNIGTLPYSKSKKELGPNVYVTKKELDDLKYIKSVVKEVFIQDTTNCERKDF